MTVVVVVETSRSGSKPDRDMENLESLSPQRSAVLNTVPAPSSMLYDPVGNESSGPERKPFITASMMS